MDSERALFGRVDAEKDQQEKAGWDLARSVGGAQAKRREAGPQTAPHTSHSDDATDRRTTDRTRGAGIRRCRDERRECSRT